MAEFVSVLTDIGRAKMIAAVALGETLEFSSMAVGDGGGFPIVPDPAMKALVGERYRAGINTLTHDVDNPDYLIAELVIPSAIGGWTIHEVGVFDNLGALVVIASFPATYKPVIAEGSARELVVRVVVQMARTNVVKLTIDPGIVTATRKYVDDRIQVIEVTNTNVDTRLVAVEKDVQAELGPDKLVRLDEQARLPAVSGEQLTNLPFPAPPAPRRAREYFYGQF